MSVKQRHALDLAWRCLLTCVERVGHGVTAGEVAKEMGVCRNTAAKRLIELMIQEAVTWKTVQRGHVSVTVYGIGGYPL